MAFEVRAKGFLNEAAIRRRLGPAKLRFAKRAGSYVRAMAQRSIAVRQRRQTKAERNARVGKPPVSRTRFFKQSILYAYDTASDAILIGPKGGKRDPSPAAFERGGRFPIMVRRRDGRRRRTTGNYRRFPTMGPALQRSQSKIIEFMKDSLK